MLFFSLVCLFVFACWLVCLFLFLVSCVGVPEFAVPFKCPMSLLPFPDSNFQIYIFDPKTWVGSKELVSGKFTFYKD